MSRYVAFLRGVSPMNARMADLKACFEKTGFTGVRTVLSSGNVVFTAATTPESELAGTIGSAMARHLPRSFPVIVRSADRLRALVESDPYSGFRISPQAKRVVTFLGQPHRKRLSLPIAQDGARILAVEGEEVFTAYVPSADGPVFMTLIEKTFGKNVTTRTWDTVRKCVAAA